VRIDLPSDDSDADVQMSPLIDCVFLLLIFFLVATTLKKIEQEVPVELPQPVVSTLVTPARSDDSVLRITVDASGQVFLGGNPTPQGQWVDALTEAGAATPDRPVRVTGDRFAPWGTVLAIVNTAEFAGLTDVNAQVSDVRPEDE
jgi:biopolymer transport protein ExbD